MDCFASLATTIQPDLVRLQAICRRLRPKMGSKYGPPNAPMTAPDATERGLKPRQPELPNSAPPVSAWAPALVLAQPRLARVWGPRVSAPQVWRKRLAPPSLPAAPSWLIFSAPWTSWRISLRISSPTSSPFSPTSSQLSSTFSSRIFSSPSQAFSCSFYSFCSFFP
jgi:hypothetical protein